METKTDTNERGMEYNGVESHYSSLRSDVTIKVKPGNSTASKKSNFDCLFLIYIHIKNKIEIRNYAKN